MFRSINRQDWKKLIHLMNNLEIRKKIRIKNLIILEPRIKSKKVNMSKKKSQITVRMILKVFNHLEQIKTWEILNLPKDM
jgi:hypothetical protein